MKITLNYKDGYGFKFEGTGTLEICVDIEDLLDLAKKAIEASTARNALYAASRGAAVEREEEEKRAIADIEAEQPYD